MLINLLEVKGLLLTGIFENMCLQSVWYDIGAWYVSLAEWRNGHWTFVLRTSMGRFVLICKQGQFFPSFRRI